MNGNNMITDRTYFSKDCAIDFKIHADISDGIALVIDSWITLSDLYGMAEIFYKVYSG